VILGSVKINNYKLGMNHQSMQDNVGQSTVTVIILWAATWATGVIF